MSYHQFRNGVGAEGCPPCTFLFSDECLPCPDGSDFPECEGCVDGEPPPAAEAALAPKAAWSDTFWGAVSIGVATTLIVAVASAYLTKKMKV